MGRRGFPYSFHGVMSPIVEASVSRRFGPGKGAIRDQPKGEQ